jgi:hypothetical protein
MNPSEDNRNYLWNRVRPWPRALRHDHSESVAYEDSIMASIPTAPPCVAAWCPSPVWGDHVVEYFVEDDDGFTDCIAQRWEGRQLLTKKYEADTEADEQEIDSMGFEKYEKPRHSFSVEKLGVHVRIAEHSKSILFPICVFSAMGCEELPVLADIYFDKETRVVAVVFSDEGLISVGNQNGNKKMYIAGFIKKYDLKAKHGPTPATVCDGNALGISTGKCITFTWPE